MGWLVVIAVCVAACGRLGFESGDALVDGTGSNDGSIDSAPGVCDPPRKLCDGFEGAALDARWRSTASGITLDTSRAHRGSSSLHAHTDALAIGENGVASIGDTAVLPQDDPTVYVRAWVLFDQMPANNMGLISAVEGNLAQMQVGVFIIPDALTVYSQFDERSFETPGPPPLSTWLCLRWTLVRSQTNGSLLLDGDAGSASLMNVQTEGTAGLVDFELGIAFSRASVEDPQPPMDVWIDDVLVSTAPIACGD